MLRAREKVSTGERQEKRTVGPLAELTGRANGQMCLRERAGPGLDPRF